ncbi:MAG: hypothetical protein HKO57_06585, partial [Akkermansiaceae bacterium]|nr:hypothetical protein [Akkermansiaceae bacterium]
GDAIGSGLGFSSAIGTLALSSAGPAGGIGAWWGGNDAYIGVMFDIGGATHYGWVHAVWDPSVNTLSIDRVGYENTGAAAVVPGPDPYPIDLDITVVPNAGPEGAAMDLRWQVEAGFTYELERSDDMNTWTTIRTVTPGLCGEESFVDTPPGESTGGPYYYRVKRSSTSLLWLALGLPGRRRRTQAGG